MGFALGERSHMPTILLESHTDCDSLVNSGTFEIPRPINGPTGTDTGAIIIEVTAPGVAIRPDNVSQRCTDLASGATTERRYTPGSGWTAWEASGGGPSTPESITVNASVIAQLDTMITANLGAPYTYDYIAAAIASDVPANSLAGYIAVSNYVMTSVLWAERLTINSPRVPQTVSNIGTAPTPSYDRNDTIGIGIKFGTGDIAMDATTTPRTVYMCLDSFPTGAVWVQIYPPLAP